MIVKRKQVAKRYAPKTPAKKVRISGPSSNGVQNIIERNMLNIIKPESSEKKEKRQKIDQEEEESANYQSMGEAVGAGEGASSASMTPFEIHILSRMDAFLLEQREQRNRLVMLCDSVNNLQTSKR
ncbi:uncharacterized protein LOC116015114 [Ipomoea triloba]|uniref:uncharacterized protein LOC116015114 n=1 Tax=Ipomoea triloba TaxID=35885 RepID=UPI00125D4E7D|nr:uncharacterized protein LOC116015114 [Ipomoea triloba]